VYNRRLWIAVGVSKWILVHYRRVLFIFVINADGLMRGRWSAVGNVQCIQWLRAGSNVHEWRVLCTVESTVHRRHGGTVYTRHLRLTV
jgi:hypothetical protein